MDRTEAINAAETAIGSAPSALEFAVSHRWRAPDTTAALAVSVADQARAASDLPTAMAAEGWLLHGMRALGRELGTVARSVAALAEAQRAGEHPGAVGRLLLELAATAYDLGDRDSAQTLLAPVIESDVVDHALGADAHIEAIRCGAGASGPGDLAALDLTTSHLRQLHGEQAECGLSMLDLAVARRHRVNGKPRAAATRAREGLCRVMGDSSASSEQEWTPPHVAAWLNVELASALLDLDQAEAARRVAEPTLTWSGGPGPVVPLTRLRLMLAQRVYLPSGEHEAALQVVGRAAAVVTAAHDLPGLEADCQSLLADIHERRGALPEALAASRQARTALREHARRAEQALVLLGKCAASVAEWNARLPGPPAGSSVATLGSRPPHTPASQTSSIRVAAPDPSDRADGSGARSQWTASTLRLPVVPARPRAGWSDEAPDPADTEVGHGLDLGAAGFGWPPDMVAGGGDPAPVPGPATPGSTGTDSLPGHRSGPERTAGEPGSWQPDSGSSWDAGHDVPAVGPWSALAGWPEATTSRSSPPDPASGAGADSPWPALSGSLEDTVRTGLPTVSAPGGHAAAPEPAWSGTAPADEPAVLRSSDRAESAWSDGAAFAPGLDTAHLDRSVSGGLAEPSGSGTPLADRHPTEEPHQRDELSGLLEPGEDRHLGLVVLDIATPSGPVTGHAARELLERIAEHVRTQLPPNSGLKVLLRDAVLVVLPPVESDVVARWMRSVASGLSARWPDYAEALPRSAFRVAVGTYDPERSAADNVADLCDRLTDGPLQPAGAGTSSQGRHVARRTPPPEPPRESGSGGQDPAAPVRGARRQTGGRSPGTTEHTPSTGSGRRAERMSPRKPPDDGAQRATVGRTDPTDRGRRMRRPEVSSAAPGLACEPRHELVAASTGAKDAEHPGWIATSDVDPTAAEGRAGSPDAGAAHTRPTGANPADTRRAGAGPTGADLAGADTKAADIVEAAAAAAGPAAAAPGGTGPSGATGAGPGTPAIRASGTELSFAELLAGALASYRTDR